MMLPPLTKYLAGVYAWCHDCAWKAERPDAIEAAMAHRDEAQHITNAWEPDCPSTTTILGQVVACGLGADHAPEDHARRGLTWKD